jgi:hypothetical protein
MDDSQKWAKAVRASDRLMHGYHNLGIFEEPRLIVQRVTYNVILCAAPVEYFSDRMPTWPRAPLETDLLPIDELYGVYDAESRSIQIFVDRIKQDASLFGENFEDFLEIVRLHEYAHAVVHLGVRSNEISSTLSNCAQDGLTGWKTFIERRTSSFHALDKASSEFLAQAITYRCLSEHNDHRISWLIDVFESIEKRQPSYYVVPEDIKAASSNMDWSLALQAARQEIDAFRGDSFSMYRGLLALVREFCHSVEETNSSQQEWVVQFDDDAAVGQLRADLSANEPIRKPDDVWPKYLVDCFSGLRVEVFAREHPPPHFRVRCGGESANYQITDCAQLNGGLRREYGVIRKWHVENKEKLIAAWNQRRPSDCPVGNYREI